MVDTQNGAYVKWRNGREDGQRNVVCASFAERKFLSLADGSITVRVLASNTHKDPWKGLMGMVTNIYTLLACGWRPNLI